MPGLLEMARRIAAEAIPLETIEYGGDPLTSPNPWLGTMRSKSADQVPRNYMVGGSDFLYLPRSHTFKRRSGQTQAFDTFGGGAVGMLPAKWSGKGRWLDEFLSESISDGVPTMAALVTKETVASGLDDGRFSQFWLRDQISSANYTVGSEYDGTSYPAIGSHQSHKITPLWYDSGDGGLTRGTTEFARRFFFSGSRRFLKVGNQTHFPSVLGTPSRWRGQFRPTVAVTNQNNRLMPTGPLPPLHAGTLTAGTLISTAAVTIRPDADVTDGGWLNASASAVDLYASIDETTLDLADYITSAGGGAACTVGLSDPGITPSVTDTVTIRLTSARPEITPTTNAVLLVELLEGATSRAAFSTTYGVLAYYTGQGLALTATQIASVTDWTNLRLKFTVTGSASLTVRIYQASVEISQSGIETQGSWKGSDKFYYSLAYRFEDGSVWAPCQPRAPGTLQSAGFNLFTVDPAGPDNTYSHVLWSNIPIGPYGVVGRLLLRTTKISAVAEDNLQLDPFALRVIWEIQDNTTTTYQDFFGADDSLTEDVAEAFIRYDHIMAPRARYIFGGDMRVCHAYGGSSPCAVEIAPVGRAADYDLNLADDSSSAYASQGSWMQIGIDTSGVGTLTLIQGDGATPTNTKTFAFAAGGSYDTLQKLVDGINVTSFATDGQQWRAQLCPGANPDATTLSLTPHNRAIASCVIDNTAKTITKAGGGLSKVAVGQLISGAAEETGAFITVITSDTSLTYSGTLTTGTETLYFYNGLGDSQITDPDTSALGFQRVICGALPGFLYFTKTYLNTQTFDKQSVWMTVASPGSVKSAANCFSGRASNRFFPPDASAGISMGGAPCDQGFVVPFAGAVYAIKNTRDFSSGIDQDYKMIALNHSRGCCAWNTVVPGNKFVPYLTPQGLFAADLDREALLSDRIFLHSPATGDFDYEIPLCVAAAGADTDGAYASARIMRSAIWVNYRDSASTGRPDRQVVYDFSSGTAQSGLDALFREDGTPWGWSTELVRPFTAMGSGRRSDGEHLYGWNDANAGSTGDGRIDELETSDTDNGTAIAGSVLTPWEKGDEQRQVSGQEIVLEHTSPAGSTGSLTFYRSYSEDAYALTPSTGSTVVVRDVKMLPQAGRVQSAACKVGYSQATGGAREVRKISLRLKKVRAYN